MTCSATVSSATAPSSLTANDDLRLSGGYGGYVERNGLNVVGTHIAEAGGQLSFAAVVLDQLWQIGFQSHAACHARACVFDDHR